MNMHGGDTVGANRLLGSLPPAVSARLCSALEPVALTRKQVLAAPGVPISHVYFPTTSVASLLTVVDGNGENAIEIATVGNEGVVGLPVFLGVDRTPGRAICQIAGAALRMPADAFRAAVAAEGPLHARLHRYAQALFTQVAQAVACNPSHRIEARCARWLLVTHDRVGRDTFPLTQEFLAQMLGARRATVTTTAGRLQQAGVIRYHRGVITIRDREGLEAAACTCYRIVAAELHRLLGDGAPAAAAAAGS